MKKSLSFYLAIILLITSLSPLKAIADISESNNCENGECIEGYIHRLESLNALYMTDCLPKDIAPSKIEAHILRTGVTEICWSYITEINYLEGLIQDHQSKLELKLGCEGNDCKLPGANSSINGQLNELEKVEENLCTEEKKLQISKQCPADLECALMSSAVGIGGYIAEYLIPDKYQPKNCQMGDDNCMTQLAMGFLKSVVVFFQGCWSLLKTAGSYTKEKLGKFWKWVTRAEDHSSTSQLALAKASEDEGVFKMLIKDFPGTMKKLWHGLVAAIKDWLKTDVFCDKWEGAPHFSQCTGPAVSFDCISCKGLINGMCAMSGYILAEIVPAFLTGGLVTAAKYGASGASKIAKLFKLSKAGMTAIKSSKLGKLAKTVDKVDDVVKISKGLKLAKTGIQISLQAIKTYLLTPARNILKTSVSAMNKLSQKGKIFLAKTSTGKMIVFSGTTLKKTAEVILYPIDNPLITFSYKAGERSFDKLLRLGAPKLANKSTVVASLVAKDQKIENILAKLELEKMRLKPRRNHVLLQEGELLKAVSPHRREILRSTFQADDVHFDDIIKTLYPELKYGELATKMPAEQIALAEQELFAEIHFLPHGDHRDKLLKAFKAHVAQGEARAKILPKPFKRPKRLEIFKGAIVTEGEVKKTLDLSRPLLKAAPPAYREVEKEEKKKRAEGTDN